MTPQKLNLIVPMAGFGSRFKAAGYNEYKPFIKINNRPMIDYVLSAFPDEVTKYLIVNPELLTGEQRAYLQNKKNVILIEIDGHKLGPSYSLYQAREQLPLEESWFVSYCDIAWTWNFDEVLKLVQYDGIVFMRKAFHPHLVENNFSAFCRTEVKNGQEHLVEIKEKGSFTNNCSQEPLSVGVFYFKRGGDLIRATEEQIANGETVAGEYFPSVAFNKLLRDGKTPIITSDVDFFIHWGVPEQLNDYTRWRNLFKYELAKKVPSSTFDNIMCMGGVGARMRTISEQPKALIPLQGQPMYEFILGRTPARSHTLITVDKLIETLKPKQKVTKINVGSQTHSQVETLARAIPFFSEQHNFILSSCDAFGVFDSLELESFIQETKADAVIFTFAPGLMLKNLKKAGRSHHTHAKVNSARVEDVFIKSFQSDADMGFAGLLWFCNGQDFVELERMHWDDGKEPIVDHFLKHLVKLGRRVFAFELKDYIHLGTPEELNEFLFWQKYSASLG